MRQALCAPVVGVDKKGEAMLHTLVVEVLDRGAGKVFRHPCDAFDTEPALDAQFTHSMRTAFSTALDQVNRGKPDNERALTDGRWRLLHGWKWKTEERNQLRPLMAPSGASASAAAMRLWWFALLGNVPDDRIIILAQINDSGEVVPVANEPIRPKLEAVIQAVKVDAQRGWQCFDTVAVVGENLTSAQEAIEAAVEQGRLSEGQLEAVDIAHPENRRCRATALSQEL